MLVLRYFSLVLMLELLWNMDFLEHLFSDFEKLNKKAGTFIGAVYVFHGVFYNLSLRPCVLQFTSLIHVLFLSGCTLWFSHGHCIVANAYRSLQDRLLALEWSHWVMFKRCLKRWSTWVSHTIFPTKLVLLRVFLWFIPFQSGFFGNGLHVQLHVKRCNCKCGLWLPP